MRTQRTSFFQRALKRLNARLARFRQVKAEGAYSYRDVLIAGQMERVVKTTIPVFDRSISRNRGAAGWITVVAGKPRIGY